MSMKEKIARAIERSRMSEYGWSDDEFDTWWSRDSRFTVKEDAYDQADAVLEALMEPTEGMMEAGRPIDRMALRDCDSIFQAMICAAKEGK